MTLRELWWECIVERLKVLKISLPIALKIEWFIHECDLGVSPGWLRDILEYIPAIKNDWSIIAIENMSCQELIDFFNETKL